MSDGMSEQGDVVFSGEHLRATMFNGEASRLLITFSFREAGRKHFNPAQMSYSAQKRGFAQLCIATRRNCRTKAAQIFSVNGNSSHGTFQNVVNIQGNFTLIGQTL